GLLRWNRTGSDLQARYVGKNELSRINRNHLRPGEDFLRPASRHLLATDRSHPGRWPVHRYRTELSRCHLLWQRRGEENCRGFKRETHAFWKIQETDRDRNIACDEILGRRRLSPEILPGKPTAFRSFRRRIRPRVIQEGQVGRRTMIGTLDPKVPPGPLDQKWRNHQDHSRLVSPNNRRKLEIIVVGSGLAGGSAAATLCELGYRVKCFCFQDSPRRAHSIAAQGGINAAKNYQNDGDSVYRLFYDTIKGGDFRSRE